MLRLQRASDFNLTLEGTVGSFHLGAGRAGQHSLKVKYFLTHVGLNFATGSNDAMLRGCMRRVSQVPADGASS